MLMRAQELCLKVNSKGINKTENFPKAAEDPRSLIGDTFRLKSHTECVL